MSRYNELDQLGSDCLSLGGKAKKLGLDEIASDLESIWHRIDNILYQLGMGE